MSIFAKYNKPVDVIYTETIEFENTNFPLSLYPEIKKEGIAPPLGCPAVKALSKRMYAQLSPITIDLKFGISKVSGEFEWEYNMDKWVNKPHDWTDSLHEFVNSMIATVDMKPNPTLQFMTPWTFITDDPELEITILSPFTYHNIKTNNVEYVPGMLKPYGWARPLNSAWQIVDNKKQGSISFVMGKPVSILLFNKPVNLMYKAKTKEIDKFMKSINNIVDYISRPHLLLTKTVLSRRPKKLL